MNLTSNIVSRQVTFKASGARFDRPARAGRPRFEPDRCQNRI